MHYVVVGEYKRYGRGVVLGMRLTSAYCHLGNTPSPTSQQHSLVGSFEDEEEAARAYDRAAEAHLPFWATCRELGGSFATLRGVGRPCTGPRRPGSPAGERRVLKNTSVCCNSKTQTTTLPDIKIRHERNDRRTCWFSSTVTSIASPLATNGPAHMGGATRARQSGRATRRAWRSRCHIRGPPR
jgi:hypothetical protein